MVLLESALNCLLEGRLLSNNKSFSADYPEVCTKFWSQLQLVLKKMLSLTVATTTKKNVNSQQVATKSGDVGKLKELYKMALKYTELCQLHSMRCTLLSELTYRSLMSDNSRPALEPVKAKRMGSCPKLQMLEIMALSRN
ncbi:hypothetical protein Leryth_021652 [Lithospermum erythrorhizon]|nr:hypothetical protein Leryth_021652 [Lithospermum erythrorhizon]